MRQLLPPLLLLSACATADVDALDADTGLAELPVDHAPVGVAAAPFTFARGMACGVSYDDGTANKSFPCLGSYPMTRSPGWAGSVGGYSMVKRDLGDWGRAAGQGFEAYELVSGVVAGSSTSAAERGTVCGFGHTRNMRASSCFGVNSVLVSHVAGQAPALSCPSGWTGRSFSDSGSGGHSWYWCERSVQPAAPASAPQGVACGMTGTGMGAAWCGTRNVALSGCDPNQYRTLTWSDWGRPGGQGLMVCVHR
ncbi:MAG TPA: hypothetical protein PKA64_00455 [Myxococcota bacterium]|nr:hypothetical protein [Myxococcota bacterium]